MWSVAARRRFGDRSPLASPATPPRLGLTHTSLRTTAVCNHTRICHFHTLQNRASPTTAKSITCTLFEKQRGGMGSKPNKRQNSAPLVGAGLAPPGDNTSANAPSADRQRLQ